MSEQLPNYQDDEITLKELILKIKEYIQEIFRSYYILAICIALGIGYKLNKHYSTDVTYSSELRFIVEGQGGSGALGGLLGQFGIQTGGEGGINPYKVVEVTRSSQMTEKILFRKLENGELVANALIDDLKLREKWAKSKKPERAKFKFGDNLDNNDTENKKIYKTLYYALWGGKEGKNSKMTVSFNEDTGIYTIKATTRSEELTTELIESSFMKTKDFFENELFSNSSSAARILKHKVDSLKTLMDRKSYSVGKFEDTHKGLISSSREVPKNIMSRDINMLSIAYGEALKNYEMTDYNLQTMQPLFKVIDHPLLPIDPKESSLIFSIIIGLIFGLFFAAFIIVGRKLYKDTMGI